MDEHGRMLLLVVTALSVAVMAPAAVFGGPLADDHEACVALLDRDLGTHLRALADFSGAVRPARYLEVGLIAGLCPHLPFGVLVAVPLALTVALAWAARGLLADLRVREPWASIGGALTLLEPLGTEASLWPSALHVPLGLLLGVWALRLLHRGSWPAGAVLGLGACLSTEHMIFALPLAAWAVTPPPLRRRAAGVAAVVTLGVLVLYSAAPGISERTTISAVERLLNLVRDPVWFVRFPVIGLGIQSIPTAFVWALPWSAAVLLAGGVLGTFGAPRLLAEDEPAPRIPLRTWLVLGAILVLVNVPALTTVPREDSPRVFTATWLLLCAGVALLGSTVRWRRLHVAGAVAGAAAAGAVLSMAFSVAVRVETHRFNADAFAHIAELVEAPTDVVAVCGIRPRVMDLHPAGAYTLHELLYDWAPGNALRWHTGKRAEFLLFVEQSCPADVEADVVIPFSDLLTAHRLDGR